ncbi:hypothetical protein 2204_scaffold14_00044 [Bacteriophage sp.]|nr:hypothetical protein 2204_scaffold14_00044 [Bacteriophage sp.]
MCSDHIREVQAHGLRVAVINSTERIPVLRPAVRSHVPADCHNLPRCQLDVLLCHDDASFSMAHHTGVKVFVLAVAFIAVLAHLAIVVQERRRKNFIPVTLLENVICSAQLHCRLCHTNRVLTQTAGMVGMVLNAGRLFKESQSHHLLPEVFRSRTISKAALRPENLKLFFRLHVLIQFFVIHGSAPSVSKILPVPPGILSVCRKSPGAFRAYPKAFPAWTPPQRA